MGTCAGNHEKINRTIIVNPRRITVKKVDYDYQMTLSDIILGVDSSVSAITITLPKSSDVGEQILWIKDIGVNAFFNNITINTISGDTIIDVASGQTSTIIGVNGGALEISSDGINEYWII